MDKDYAMIIIVVGLVAAGIVAVGLGVRWMLGLDDRKPKAPRCPECGRPLRTVEVVPINDPSHPSHEADWQCKEWGIHEWRYFQSKETAGKPEGIDDGDGFAGQLRAIG